MPRKSSGGSSRTSRASAGARTSRRSDLLDVEFDLRDVEGRPVQDPEAFFTFRRLSDNRQIGGQIRLVLDGSPVRFAIPAQAGDPVVCDLDLQRYRFARSPVFFRTPGPPIRRTCALLREPLEWQPAFTAWTDLPAAFSDLVAVLTNSTGVSWPGSGPSPGTPTGAVYDALTGADTVLAKTALLNIHQRLRTAREPISGTRSWFSFVDRIIALDRERVLAFVQPGMETSVRHIHDHIDEFRADFERTPAENHRRNVPPDLRSRITRMVSIKSAHTHGNFQLTVSHLDAPDAILLDADIDESGRLFAHLIDTFRHRFTGGTHPHDIHELLWHQHGADPGFDLGYRLV